MQQQLAVIGVPSSAGAFAPGQEQAPAALRAAGLIERLQAAGIAVTDRGDSAVWRWRPDRQQPRAQNLEAVIAQAEETAHRVRAAVAAGEIPLVLGGDCSIELGTVAGFLSLPRYLRIGLLYVDLHADLNVPDSEPEGAFDWMGMAHLLGEEQAVPELSRFGPRFPLLDAADVCIFGHGLNRATPWEREAIARRDVRTVPVEDVAADPEGAAAGALAAFADYDALLIHFDVDVIDFTDAPLSENTGRNEGLTLDQAFRALRVLTASPIFRALTITELNPLHGEEDGATLERFVGGLVETLVRVPVLGGAEKP
jgi:arginase